MKLDFVPLLPQQRDLYRIPRGMERFRSYLAEMIDPETRDLRLPLVAMNPMGKDHVPALLDELIALDADAEAARAVAEAALCLNRVPGEYKVTLVLSDDKVGGWTNRYTTEHGHRFEGGALLKRGWLVGILWTSEPASLRTVREEALSAVHRAAYIQQHGMPETLREKMAQEGHVLKMAGCEEPRFQDPEEIAYTREVLAPHLEARDMRTSIECLFGDVAAHALGFMPRGLSPQAGLALALYDARSGREA